MNSFRPITVHPVTFCVLLFVLLCQASAVALGFTGMVFLLVRDHQIPLREKDWQGTLCCFLFATFGLFIFGRALFYWFGKYTYDDQSIEFENLAGARVKNHFSELKDVDIPESMNLLTSRIFPAHSLYNTGMTFTGARLEFKTGDSITYFPHAAPMSFNRFVYEKAVRLGVDVEQRSLRRYLFLDYYDSLK